MTPIDLDKIKEAAGKATPGPWFVAGAPWLPSDVETYVLADSPDPHAGSMVCDMPTADMAGVEDVYEDDEWRARNDANAKHIAACDPQTILSLVAVVEALQELVAIDDDYDLSDQMDGDICGAVKGYSPRLIAALEKSRAALHPFSHINGEQP